MWVEGWMYMKHTVIYNSSVMMWVLFFFLYVCVNFIWGVCQSKEQIRGDREISGTWLLDLKFTKNQ